MEAPPIHFCPFHRVLSPPILLAAANHFYQNPLYARVWERERERRKKLTKKRFTKSNVSRKFLFFNNSRTILKIKISGNFYFASRIKISEKFYFRFGNRIYASREFLILWLMSYLQVIFHVPLSSDLSQ